MDAKELPEEIRAHLRDWIRQHRFGKTHYLSHGYQGHVLLYRENDYELVVKIPPRWFPYNWLGARLLRHEAAVYERLKGIYGIPRSHGLIDNRYLVLDFVPGRDFRKTDIEDREGFYREMLSIIRRMHGRGVGHGDLKKKDNILVGPNSRPWLIDFGVAVIRRKGFSPLNHFLFNTARRFDLNAWVKHKYRRRLDEVSAPDSRYLRQTWLEQVARRTKRTVRRIVRRLIPSLRRNRP